MNKVQQAVNNNNFRRGIKAAAIALGGTSAIALLFWGVFLTVDWMVKTYGVIVTVVTLLLLLVSVAVTPLVYVALKEIEEFKARNAANKKRFDSSGLD